jgi:DeoR/GlpR family transcriptional regulator of sugar metabolism
MKPKERRSGIFDIIRQEGRISVERLVAEFNSSAETIRRDLNKLSKTGKIQKIHGGAILPGSSVEGPYQQRMGENVKAKRLVAQKACTLISPGDTLFIDTGSSTLSFAEEVVTVNDLTVITNSAEIARVISSSANGARVYLLGGEYKADTFETAGPIAIAQLNHFQANHAILATGAIDIMGGFMNYDFDEAAIARAMLERAENIIVLADSSKFGRKAPYAIGRLDQFDQLVCEREPRGVLRDALIQQNVNIVC